jgi:hypothetical protein
VFMAGARIAQHFGRPGTPNDQAWVESFFGHLKAENPHLERIVDPGELEAELTRLRTSHYNTVRLHEGIGYLTPDDEHTGRGPAIRAGLDAAHPHQVHFLRHTSLQLEPHRIGWQLSRHDRPAGNDPQTVIHNGNLTHRLAAPR